MVGLCLLYTNENGGIAMGKMLHRLLCFVCALMLCLAQTSAFATDTDNSYATSYAYALNSAMLGNGVVSTESCGDYILFGENYPTGVLYADLVEFSNNTTPCLLIFRTEDNCVAVDIYKYNGKTAEYITTIRKSYAVPANTTVEVALGDNRINRFIVFNEYTDGILSNQEHYTVLNGNAYCAVKTPENVTFCGVVSFSDSALHPEVDVSVYNKYLDMFFSTLKDMSAENVSYTNILDDITEQEKEKISRVLKKTAEFNTFDIGDYATMSEYSLAVKMHEGEGKFNAITHIYDLGEELYYVRYSTDICFYNGTILRRCDTALDNYQILCVRNDFIPLSDMELSGLKEAYLKNKLVLQKSAGTMERKSDPVIKINKLDIEKKVDLPQMVSPNLRKPVALIGGGVCLALFVLLWYFISSNDDDK